LAIFSTRYMYILGHFFYNKVYVHTWPFFLQQGICTYLAIHSSTRYMSSMYIYLVEEWMANVCTYTLLKKEWPCMYIYLVVEKMAKYVHISCCRKNGTRYMYILGHSFYNKVYVHTWPFFLQQGICTYLAIFSSTRYMYILGHFFYNKVYVGQVCTYTLL
jgi:hypothetical protein